MEFCNVCDNLFYLQLQSEKDDMLQYYCRCCGNTDTSGAATVQYSVLNYTKNAKFKPTFINAYTKFDPTLPNISSIPCVNEDCDSNHDKAERNIKYIRYDDANIRIVYLCIVCDTTWNNPSVINS